MARYAMGCFHPSTRQPSRVRTLLSHARLSQGASQRYIRHLANWIALLEADEDRQGCVQGKSLLFGKVLSAYQQRQTHWISNWIFGIHQRLYACRSQQKCELEHSRLVQPRIVQDELSIILIPSKV